MTNSNWLTFTQIAIYVGAILAATGTLGAWWFSNKIEEEKEAKDKVTGVLIPNTVQQQRPISKYPMVLQIGNSGVVFRFQNSNPSKGYNLDYILGLEGTNFTIFFDEDNIVKVSLTVRDKDGKIVAELIKNEWKLNKGSFWDRNYTKDALEVKAPDGSIVLQTIAKDDRIVLQIRLYDKNGNGIVMIADPSGSGALMHRSDGVLDPTPIQPMFLYPSDTHLGELSLRN